MAWENPGLRGDLGGDLWSNLALICGAELAGSCSRCVKLPSRRADAGACAASRPSAGGADHAVGRTCSSTGKFGSGSLCSDSTELDRGSG
jgi:hypothetical protein